MPRTAKVLRTLTFVSLLLLLATAASADTIRESWSVSPGGLLELEAEGTKVEILASSNREVELELRRVGNTSTPIEDDYDLDFSQQGDTVRLVIDRKKKINWGWKRGLEATIRVPSSFDATVSSAGGSVRVSDLRGDVDVRSAGGSIEMGAIDGQLQLRSAGGSVRVAGVSGEANIDTSGGSITIERADAAVTATSSGGSIRVDEIAGPLQASTSGGSVTAYLTNTPGSDSELRTSGGGIRVRLASNVGLDIDARASGGSVSSEIDVDASEKSKTKLVGSVGGGGPRMVMRTSGGSVRILSE